MKNWLIALMAALGCLGWSAKAHAIVLPPGGTVVPDPGTETGTLVTSTSGTFLPNNGVQPKGTYVEAVYNNGGTLDFVFQVTVSKGVVESISMGGFAGYNTSVNQTTTVPTDNAPGFAATGTAADDATRTSLAADGGDTVRFERSAASPWKAASATKTTEILIIRTDATQFVAGAMGFQDGTGSSAAAFQPRRFGSPEPASLVLMGGLAAGFGWPALRRRWRRSEPAVG